MKFVAFSIVVTFTITMGLTAAFQLVPPTPTCTGGSVYSSLHIRASNCDEEAETNHETRRTVLSTLMMIPLLVSASPALAALPMTIGEADGLAARAERAIRPKPPKALRPKLSQDFAVLLMRSSYNALDEIDCVAMDQFQRDFFLIRQAEYEPYVNALGPGMVQQGSLVDPYYFDFISFAQYATISREISQNPPFVFEEQQPVEVGEGEPQKFVPTLIKRDPSLTNDMLGMEHDRLVGVAILDRLDEIFGETDTAIPKIAQGSKPDAEILLASLTQMVKLFLINGFAWDGRVSISKPPSSASGASGTEFCMELTSPATMWSGKALQLRRSYPVNDFVLKTAKTFLSRCGYSVASSSVKYDGNTEISYVMVR